jgi:hypothetical protein
MSNVVEFSDLAPAEGYSEAYIDKLWKAGSTTARSWPALHCRW